MAMKAANTAVDRTAAKAKAATPKRKTKAAKPAPAVKVRMYCQGLGDCFLLTFPPSDPKARPVRVLIDCGVFQRSPGEAPKLRQVAQDIKAETDGEIDLLVVTHEHWDHVAGFSHANDIFSGFTFKNVWLSWAENGEDADARAIKAELAKKKQKVKQALAKAHLRLDRNLKANADDPQATKLKAEFDIAAGVLEFFGPDDDGGGPTLLGVAGGKPSKPAAKGDGPKTLGETMDWLRGKVRPGDFCSPGECRPLPGAKEVKVYVLGPPRSVSALRKEDPSKGQAYELQVDRVSLLSALEWLESGSPDAPPGPFEARHRLSPEDARLDPFFREIYGFEDDPLGDAGEGWRRIDDEWLGGLNRLALQLDSGVNNTSLALVFELPDGRTLVFPGDAQIGNWLSWKEVAFKAEGRNPPVTTRDLLGRAVLYKVGHHGSKNATLKPDGMEAMTCKDLVALIPTDQAYAATKSPPHGWKMPEPELNRALIAATQGQILLSDLDEDRFIAEAVEFKKTLRGEIFHGRVRLAPTKFDPDPKDLSPPRPLYVEYSLPL